MSTMRTGWPTQVGRAEIAAALSTVDGVEGVPVPPTTPAPGTGWAVWSTRTPVNDCLAEVTYYVYVTLPAGQQSAAVEADAIVWDVEAALGGLGSLVATDPVALANGTGGESIPAIRCTLKVESEKPL
jgi:hypothetical protein